MWEPWKMQETALFMYIMQFFLWDDMLIVNLSAWCYSTVPSILHCFLWLESRRPGKNQFSHQIIGYSAIYRASECLVVLFRSIVADGFSLPKGKVWSSFYGGGLQWPEATTNGNFAAAVACQPLWCWIHKGSSISSKSKPALHVCELSEL